MCKDEYAETSFKLELAYRGSSHTLLLANYPKQEERYLPSLTGMLYCSNTPTGRRRIFSNAGYHSANERLLTTQLTKGYYTANSWFPPMDSVYNSLSEHHLPPTSSLCKRICLLLLLSEPAHRSPLDFMSKIAIL